MEIGNVTQAAAVCGISRRCAYYLHESDPEFRADWDDAIEAYIENLEAECDRRGKDGIDKPVFWKGKKVATVKQYSDTLLMFRLKALAPEKYRERTTTQLVGKDDEVLSFAVNFVGAGAIV